MSMFDKFKVMAEKTVGAIEKGLDSTVKGVEGTVKQLKEEGLQATAYDLGNKVGSTVKGVSEGVTDYATSIEKANKKAANPVGISFKSGTVSNTTAKSVIKAINTIRIVGQDAKDKLEEFATPEENKKSKIK